MHLGSIYLIVRDFNKSIIFYKKLLEMKVTSKNMERFAQFEGHNISIMNGYFDYQNPELTIHKGEYIEKFDNYRIMETLQQEKAPSKDEFLQRMNFYAKQNKDAYKFTLKEFGLSKMQWYCEYEKLYKDTHEVPESLHRRYKLGIIANQVLGTEQRISNLGIRHFFDVIATSAEENISKSAPRLFHIALERANCSIYINKL